MNIKTKMLMGTLAATLLATSCGSTNSPVAPTTLSFMGQGTVEGYSADKDYPIRFSKEWSDVGTIKSDNTINVQVTSEAAKSVMSSTLAGLKEGLSSICDTSEIIVNNTPYAHIGNLTFTDSEGKTRYINVQSNTVKIDSTRPLAKVTIGRLG
ncbi:hypothetical protein [Deinococcus hopiensis]|uniref:Uncharacterized protein n=1 Tax=Deinococcus hopiensis KR-140 TaxID=695939 RepID=A0A1W1UDJ6_9DEIO|nr:hypothetical protein [Deinococcus hopiensis]SMB79147.1 hypothetical protein SAMN00790413_05795 [Deinococcus hopiensis KR-140]